MAETETRPETHVISTSTPASPDEPQPILSQEEDKQPQEVEAQENFLKSPSPLLVIQPQTFSQEELDIETAQQEDITPGTEDADADSPTKKSRRKRRKRKS